MLYTTEKSQLAISIGIIQHPPCAFAVLLYAAPLWRLHECVWSRLPKTIQMQAFYVAIASSVLDKLDTINIHGFRYRERG